MAGVDEMNGEAYIDPQIRQFQEIGRQLRSIGEKFKYNEKQHFDSLVQQLVDDRTGSIALFTDVLRQFVAIVKKSVTFPVSLIKESINTLYLIWRNPDVAVAGRNGLSATEVNCATVVPDEIKNIDVDSIEMYLKALKHGYEEVQHIRLMIIGQYSVGKTNLVFNLLGKDKSEIQSTDGIDVHITECNITDDCEWTVNPLCSGETNFKDKLVSAMSKRNDEPKSETDGQICGIQNPDIETIYGRCSTTDTEQNSKYKEEFNKVKAILEDFVDGGDPLLVDYTKQVVEAVEIGPLPCAGRTISMSVWDFAGQYIYYTTHHFFMNTRSIYLLVMNISQPLDMLVEDTIDFAPAGSIQKGYTCLDAFKFWLNSIHTYSQREKDNKPSVILVGTHKDKIPGTIEEKRKFAELYFNQALEAFINSPVLNYIHHVKFFINNHSPEEDVKKLKLEILKLAKSNSTWNEMVPARWIQLERSIQIMKTEGKEIISLHELEEADSQNEVPVNSRPELKLFLKFQHALGNLLYFDKETLENFIIVSPQWIIDAFKCFVTQFPDKKPKELHLWNDYEKMAIMKPSLIDAILDEKEYLVDYKNEIIKYMEQLDIMAKPSVYEFETENNDDCDSTIGKVVLDTDETGLKTSADEETMLKSVEISKINLVCDETEVSDANVTQEIQNICKKENATANNHRSDSLPGISKELDFHIVPCMLNTRPPPNKMTNLIKPQNAETTPTICFVFQGNFLPPAVFHRLLAVCINTWSVSTSERKFLLFNGLAVFDITHTTTLTLWLQDHVIFAKIAEYSAKYHIPPAKCQEVREILERALIGILGIYKKEKLLHDLPFEEYIHCGNDGDHMLGLVRVSELKEHGEMKCSDHIPGHVVDAEKALSLWFPDSFSEDSRRLSDIPSEKELAKLSGYIGKEYWHVGLQLGILQPIMEQLQLQHRDNIPHLMYSILLEWKRNQGTDATLAVLKGALETAGTDTKCLHQVFTSHKNSN